MRKHVFLIPVLTARVRKHEAGKSLCRVEKRKSYLEEVRKHVFRIPVTPAGVRSTKQARAYAEYNFINNFERNSFCYKTL